MSVGSFSQAVLSELPKGEGWKVDEDEIARRLDLRQTHLIFSIDPKGCEDVDDTLSVRYNIYLSVCLSVTLYISIYSSLSPYLFVWLSIYPSILPSIHLSVCLSVCTLTDN